MLNVKASGKRISRNAHFLPRGVSILQERDIALIMYGKNWRQRKVLRRDDRA
jgi:hypothetical protein